MQKNEYKENNPVEPEGDGAEIVKMLIEDMSRAKELGKEDWDRLNGRDWANLLCRHPGFEAKCPWEKLEGCDWVVLLKEQPQFAEKCPFQDVVEESQIDWNTFGDDWAKLYYGNDKTPPELNKPLTPKELMDALRKMKD